MTMPGEPGDATTDLSNPEQKDSAAAGPDVPEIPLLVVRPPGTGDTVRLRVGPPHASLTWAGITVTDLPTEVPASAMAGLYEAAGNAGVNLILEA
jgi:hypothetical protein